jgi:hypothetical protein
VGVDATGEEEEVEGGGRRGRRACELRGRRDDRVARGGGLERARGGG